MKTPALLASISVCLVASAAASAGPATQSVGTANYYSHLYGSGSSYTQGQTPLLAYGTRDSYRRAIANLATTVKDLTGTDAKQACHGFRTVGDCVAAAHVSSNLGVSFTTLREQMTGQNRRRLNNAIEYLRPDADSKLEAAKAFKQAKEDVAKT